MHASIVEELDDRDLTLRVALDGRALIRQERLLVVANGLLGLLRGGHRLALLKTPHRLGKHLGLAQQIVAHDLLDLLLRELGLVADGRPGDEKRCGETGDQDEGDESDGTHGYYEV